LIKTVFFFLPTVEMTDMAEKEVISGLTCICIVGIEVSVSLLLKTKENISQR
jgi:hypothetical protein